MYNYLQPTEMMKFTPKAPPHILQVEYSYVKAKGWVKTVKSVPMGEWEKADKKEKKHRTGKVEAKIITLGKKIRQGAGQLHLSVVR